MKENEIMAVVQGMVGKRTPEVMKGIRNAIPQYWDAQGFDSWGFATDVLDAVGMERRGNRAGFNVKLAEVTKEKGAD